MSTLLVYHAAKCLEADESVDAPGENGSIPAFITHTAATAMTFVVLHEGGPARIAENGPLPGALAGSGLTMDRAVRNAVRMLGVDIQQAVRMAAANPAAVLRLSDRKGQIREGYDADFVMLDKDLIVMKTYVAGRCCFDSTASL